VPVGFWRPLGIVSFAIPIVTFAYEKWMWAWIPTKVSGVPDLRGTWCATVDSDWTPPKSKVPVEPIEAYFVIRQTSTSIDLVMMTRESRSHTITARLEAADGVVSVAGVFLNESRSSVRGQSPMHYGGLIVRVGGPPPTTMHGDYWTDRSTSGEVTLKWRSRKTPGDFSTAQTLCAASK
jgi:hypothetical protein